MRVIVHCSKCDNEADDLTCSACRLDDRVYSLAKQRRDIALDVKHWLTGFFRGKPLSLKNLPNHIDPSIDSIKED